MAVKMKSMTMIEITDKVKELKELKTLAKELEKEIEKIEDEIKAEMLKRETEELDIGQYIIRWTSVLTNRFDTKAFKEIMPDVYKQYTKQVASKRFTISD